MLHTLAASAPQEAARCRISSVGIDCPYAALLGQRSEVAAWPEAGRCSGFTLLGFFFLLNSTVNHPPLWHRNHPPAQMSNERADIDIFFCVADICMLWLSDFKHGC